MLLLLIYIFSVAAFLAANELKNAALSELFSIQSKLVCFVLNLQQIKCLANTQPSCGTIDKDEAKFKHRAKPNSVDNVKASKQLSQNQIKHFDKVTTFSINQQIFFVLLLETTTKVFFIVYGYNDLRQVQQIFYVESCAKQ